MTIMGGEDFYLCPDCGCEHGVRRVISTNNFVGPGAVQPDTIHCECGCAFALAGMQPVRYDDTLCEMRISWKRRVALHERLGKPPPERWKPGRKRVTRNFSWSDFETAPSLTTVQMWVAACELQGWQIDEITSGGTSDWTVEVRMSPDLPASPMAVEVVELTDPSAVAARAELESILEGVDVDALSQEQIKGYLTRLEPLSPKASPHYTPDRVRELMEAAIASKDVPSQARDTNRVLLILVNHTDFERDTVVKAIETLTPPQFYGSTFVVIARAQRFDSYPVHEVHVP